MCSSLAYVCVRYYVHPHVCTDVRTQVKLYIRGRFYGSYYCRNLKFCTRINVYKYKRNIQESEYDDPYVTVHRLRTLAKFARLRFL